MRAITTVSTLLGISPMWGQKYNWTRRFDGVVQRNLKVIVKDAIKWI